MAACLILLSAGNAMAQDLRATLFAETDGLMKEALAAEAPLLAPKSYAAAQKAYATAEKDVSAGRADKAEPQLARANAALLAALEASELAAVTFADTLDAREKADNANAQRYAAGLWAKGEKNLGKAVTTLESGKVSSARKSAAKATENFAAAELDSLQGALLADARAAIADAEKDRVGKYAPITLERARQNVAQAETELERDRESTPAAQALAAEAVYEVRHARFIAGEAERLKGRNPNVEELILEWEQPLRELTATLDVSQDFGQGPEQPGTEALKKTQELIAQNAELRARINELEIALGDSELVVEETERLEQELKDVEALFGANQARVFRERKDLIIRLIGLSFPIGKSVIETKYYSLLKQVQEVVVIYPQSTILVEGHTDSKGGDQANLKLSQDRADAVREYLVVNQGLPAERIQAVGYGKTRPIASNETEAGREQNRRIDIVVQDARARKAHQANPQ